MAVYPKYNRDYWLYVEIKETAALKDADQFLRDIRVECCGHLSAFDIAGISYDAASQDDFFWGKPAKSMNCKLKLTIPHFPSLNSAIHVLFGEGIEIKKPPGYPAARSSAFPAGFA